MPHSVALMGSIGNPVYYRHLQPYLGPFFRLAQELFASQPKPVVGQSRKFPMQTIKYGFVLPDGDARAVSELARQAEQAGWDGVFVPEPVWHIDAWIKLTAAAMTTSRIRLGTLLSPLPRMRPWKVAAETATLDNLSGGRVILSVGVGWLYYGYQSFKDEVTDIKTRAELLDEGIDLLTLLYRGKPFKFEGKHYHVDLTATDPGYFPPPPVQQPRIPLWVVGVWPRKKSMRRVLRCDGLIPTCLGPDGQFRQLLPADLAEMKAYVDANRTLTTPFDYIIEGNTVELSSAETTDKIGPWVEAGATWWIETLYDVPEDKRLARLHQGPPRLES
jgi:hypothetical protein